MTPTPTPTPTPHQVLSSAHQDTYVVVRRIEKHLTEQSLVEQAAARASLGSGGAAGSSARLSSLGTVYTSADGEMIEQRFSMRVLPKRRVAEASMQGRVLEEIALLGSLPPSPFVPVLLACFSDSRRLFAVLSAVLVTTLQAACEALPLDEAAARFYVAGVSRALACVHEADVVCRACSLDAIMLDAKGYPQLVDLSLSKSVTNGRTHTLCGTPDYLAPEIIKMAGHGIEADYWALGVPPLTCATGLALIDPSPHYRALYRRANGRAAPHIPSRPLTPPYAPFTSPYIPLRLLMPLHPLTPLTPPYIPLRRADVRVARGPLTLGRDRPAEERDAGRCTRTHAHAHAHTHTHTHTNAHAHARTCHMHMHKHTYACM